MTLTVTWYSIICVMAAIPALRVAQIAWLRRSVPAARYLSLLMTVTAVWALCSALEYASIDIPTKITWSKLSYLGVVGSPLFFYLLALVYTNPRHTIGFRHVMTVAIVPILALALALTNEWHLLIWNAFTPSPAGDNLLIYGHGLWFWIGVFGYSYLLMLVSTIKIVRYAVQSKAPYRTQAVTLALGALIPWLGNIIYNLYLSPISGLELTPLLSICAGVVYYWGIFRVRLLDLTPIAIRTVVESMSDAMVVLDIQERVVDLNTAALRLFNSMAASPIGLPVSEVLAGWPDVLHVLDTAKSKSRAPSVVPAAASSVSGSIQEQLAMVASDNLVRDVPHSELNLAKDEFQLIHPVTGRVYNTRISTIHDAGNQYTITGRVIVLRDQTVLNQAQEALRRAAVLEERERMARELHDSLGRVLSFLAQNSQTVRNLVESGNTMAALGQLDSLSLAAQTAGMDVRKHILNMRTEMDSGQSFTAVLSQYIDHFAAITGQHVQLSLPDKNMDDVLPEKDYIQLLRIIQEFLANAHKHSVADEVTVVISLSPEMLHLSISDNGVGFDVQSPPKGFGLQMMQERAAQMKATLELRSQPGQGTQVILQKTLAQPDVAERNELEGVTIVVADDHLLFVEGMRNMLVSHGMRVVGIAMNGDEAIQLAADLKPELLLLDVSMPIRPGPQAVRLIKEASPKTRVVMLSMSADTDALIKSIRDGASGYLLKSQSSQEFLHALTAIRNGNTALAPGLAVDMADPDHAKEAVTYRSLISAGLSELQIDIMARIATGQFYKAIATDLQTSESNIKYHAERIQSILGVSSRTQLIDLAYEAGLAPDRRHKKNKDTQAE